MAKDVFIIPSEGLVQFSSSAGSGSGKIQSDGDDIVISNALGDVLLGDGTSDVFIGDGTNNVDIVFEQNGEIKDDGSGKNIIFGSKTTNVFISGSNTVALQSGGGNVGIGTTTAGTELEVVGSISQSITSTGSFGSVHTDGNVGIGTTSPSMELEVVVPANGGILVNRHATTLQSSAEVGFRHTTSEGDAALGMRSVRTNEQQSYDHELKFFTTAGGTGSNAEPHATGQNEHMFIKHSGKIGIGHGHPTALLHISGTTSTNNLFKVTDSNQADILVITSSGTAVGKVGIGTMTPQNPLSVSGSLSVFTSNNTSRLTVGEADDSGISSNNIIAIEVDGANNKSHTFTIGTGNDYIIEALGSKGDVHLSPRRDIRFGINNGSAYNFTEKMILTGSTGNLGIGTSTPQSKLTVNGDTTTSHITASGNISASGNIIGELTGIGGAVTGITSLLATDIIIGEDAQTKIDFETADEIHFYANNAQEMVIQANVVAPGADNGTALGDADQRWSDLFLATGGVINFNNGDATITGDGSNLDLVHGQGSKEGGMRINTLGNIMFATVLDNNLNFGTDVRLFITSSTGNVGIGDNVFNPGEKLEVVGNISASGAVTASAFKGDGTGLSNVSATVADESITLAKLAHAAANTVMVRDANSEGDPSFKAVTNTQILIGDGTGFTAAALSGDVTMTNGGVVTIEANAVEGSMLNTNVAGTGLTVAGNNIDVDAAQTQITSVGTLTGLFVDSHITASGNISASGNFIGHFPDTNDDASHYPVVVDAQRGTLESQNTLSINPSTNLTTVTSLKAKTHITASGNISASGNLDVTGNANIDGDLDLAGKSSFTGNITASGNISASGDIITTGTGSFAGGGIFGSHVSFSDKNITNVGTIDVDKIRADAATNVNIELVTSGIKFNAEAGDVFTFNDVYNNTDLQYYDANEDIIFTIDQSVPGVAIGALGGAPTEALDVEGNIQSSGNVVVAGSVIHKGDTNTSIAFTVDAIAFNAGGVEMLKLTEAATNTIALGAAISTHITASGNISASGNYIGNRQFNKTSNTDADHQGDVVFFGGTTSMDAGKIYAYGNDGAWNLSDADHNNLSGSGLLGVALGAASDTNGMLLRGTVTLDHDPGAVGDVLYLSTTAGRATSTVPSGNTDIARVVGYCLDASNGQIWFNPDNTFVEVSA